MKVGVLHSAVVSVVFSLISYVLLSFTINDSAIALTISLSLLIGGSVIPLLASFLHRHPAISQSESNGELATLYVGNLPYRANEEAVRAFFSDRITVQSVRLMKDRKSGKRKGYGFLEVITSDVDKVVDELNDVEFQDRNLKIRLAKDKVNE